jgi:aryl-phospho-beta-D-glucosidase BglC (GH1 family)
MKTNCHPARYTIALSIFILSVLTSLNVTNSYSQGFLKTSGTKILNEKNENVLLRGIGFGGWMLQEGYMMKLNGEGQQYRLKSRIQEIIGEPETTRFYDRWLDNHTRKIDIDSLKAWGFNSVRLPIHYNLYTLPVDQEPVAGKQTWLDRGFKLTDSLMAWCEANQMYLILDLHAAPGGQGNDNNISDRDPSKPSLWDSEANQQKTIALWTKLAERYKDEPWIGGYDIINEPNWGFEHPEKDKNGLQEKRNAPLRKLMVDITKAIRSVDKNHIIIIEGNGWGNNYNGILPVWDNNMVLSFHKYWNYNDAASLEGILKIRTENNVPVWLGETGENSNLWFRDAIHLLERNNIGWAWWPLKKIGVNNPLEIPTNPEYEKLVQYLNGHAEKPSAAEVSKGLMALAESAKLENNIVHRDVIDAMIRQPHDDSTRPYKAITVGDNTVVPAVDYDLGRNGFAYFDLDTADYHVATGKYTAGNRGRVYRNDGVDIAVDSTAKDKYYVNYIEDGEWLQYSLQVPKTGNYQLKLNTASIHGKGKLSVYVNGKLVAAKVPVPNTGSWFDFKTFDVKRIPLKAGKQVVKIVSDSGGYNFSHLQLIK